MNRFNTEKKKRCRSYGPMAAAAAMAAALIFFYGAVSGVAGDTRQREKENLEHALEHAVILCYSLEGVYPDSLEYLKEHYGIRWRKDEFRVDFEWIGSNLPPDITVIPRD